MLPLTSVQVDTNNGYAHLQLLRGSQEEVKAMQEEDVQQRVQVWGVCEGSVRRMFSCALK